MKTAIFSTMAALAVVLTLGGCGKIDLVPAETGRVAQLDSSHGLRSWSLSGASSR
jgi:predicted small lipoprotein YifL